MYDITKLRVKTSQVQITSNLKIQFQTEFYDNNSLNLNWFGIFFVKVSGFYIALL